ncbi:DUF3987 domain-containing protein [uncultured Duncaniella sp.]|uniref:DUF3987 domain-containing protein n=2 Tax=uncultured Duncaniella sp. TaxID=2768039 RepID=UPI0025A207AB|nr:DUF3987 domain-containing protein [uncultured Duncaniella sp.]
MEKNITPDSVISALMNHAKSADSDFPVHVFPAKMQRIILELNTTCAFPIDYTASAMLAAISVAIGNTHRVEIKRSWQESAIVYIAIVGRPGDCKSHPLTFVMRPLVNADWKNNQEFQKKHCEYQHAVAMSRKERINSGLDEFPKEPKRLRYLVSDVTQEGLSAIHSHNPRGLCLWVDELSAWFKNFTRYNTGSEEQFWLSAFNGSTTMSDRKNCQHSIFIKRPFISVVGTIQKRLLTELANGERAANGFIDRILFAMTKSNGKPRWNENEVRDDLDREWERILNRLLSVECVVNEDKESIPTVMRFTPDAKRRLYEWQHENASLCDKEMSDNVVSFFCKLEIYVLRFCLILRLIRWAVSEDQPRPSDIGDDDVTGAIELAEYFRSNALSVLTCISEERLNELHRTVYDHLAEEFSTADGIRVAARFGMKDHTFKMFLTRNLNTLFRRVRQGLYRKQSCYSANNVTPHENESESV